MGQGPPNDGHGLQDGACPNAGPSLTKEPRRDKFTLMKKPT